MNAQSKKRKKKERKNYLFIMHINDKNEKIIHQIKSRNHLSHSMEWNNPNCSWCAEASHSLVLTFSILYILINWSYSSLVFFLHSFCVFFLKVSWDSKQIYQNVQNRKLSIIIWNAVNFNFKISKKKKTKIKNVWSFSMFNLFTFLLSLHRHHLHFVLFNLRAISDWVRVYSENSGMA